MMKHKTRWPLAAALALALAVTGCAGAKPFSPSAIDDIPPGPGLFTGKDGEIKIAR